MRNTFLEAIQEKKKITVTFNSKSKGVITRTCIPFDFGPLRRKNLQVNPDRYHMYDLDSPNGAHTLGITEDQVVSIAKTDLDFEPATYVTWTPNWYIARDWGAQS